MPRIDIVSGCLGAGKTTLIKRLLGTRAPDEKLVVLENEFGKVAIDGNLLQNSGIEVREISAGCICCNLLGGFQFGLVSLIHELAPDRILVEPTGLAELSQVIEACRAQSHRLNLSLGFAAVVVDATRIRENLERYSRIFTDQIACAGALLLSRTERLDGAQRREAVALVRDINPRASILALPWEGLSDGDLLAACQGTLPDLPVPRRNQPHHHDHGPHYDAWGLVTQAAYDRRRLERTLAALPPQVLRAKGVVQGDTGWLHFDYIPGEWEIRPSEEKAEGRISVIGEELEEDVLEQLFRGES